MGGCGARLETPATAADSAASNAQVTAGGPAANAGLTVGDLILSVNGSPIETAEKGLRALNERGAAPCLLVVAGALVEVDTPCTC